MPETVDPVPRSPWVAIQRNPRSGTGKGRDWLLDLVRELRRLGLRPRMFKNRQRMDAWLAQPAIREQLACIVAAGGDGTVADVFNRHPGIRLAILPLGTENLLARFLGIPHSGKGVAKLIATGHVRVLDLCQMGQRRFALMASAGFDAEVVRRLHSSRHGHISRRTYIQPTLEAVRKYEYPEIRVWVDGASAAEPARLAMVVNVPIYALGFLPARKARGD